MIGVVECSAQLLGYGFGVGCEGVDDVGFIYVVYVEETADTTEDPGFGWLGIYDF